MEAPLHAVGEPVRLGVTIPNTITEEEERELETLLEILAVGGVQQGCILGSDWIEVLTMVPQVQM